jgi:glycosyltransferase involved in cell wall biosynthesis
MRIAYFVNQYPAVSHTFIRREIKAIEELGIRVLRYALRPGDNLVDPDDKEEQSKTRYIVRAGLTDIIACFMRAALAHPFRLLHVVGQAIRMGWRSDRGILRHLIYVVEAAVLADRCRRDDVRHVHAHFGTNPAAIVMFARLLSGITYSFTAHGSEEFEKAPLLSLNAKVRHASFVVCVSFFGRGQLMRWTSPEHWHKFAVVRCGLDAHFFSNRAIMPPETPQFVCVGRLDEHKAQIVLVAAVGELRRSGIACRVVLVGDGEMRSLVEDAIRRAQLDDRITITGWVSGERVRTEIAAARALILPSVSENLPVVIMEAFALGRPVISTYVAGIPELVQPGVTGWLVPASDELALAQAMREALSAEVEQLATMGAAGRARVAERHDSLKEAAVLKNLFEQHVR